MNKNERFMNLAINEKLKSEDPNTKVGAIIVLDDVVVGSGYNKFPDFVKHEEFSWEREGEYLETKYPFVVHAEQVALLSAKCNLVNAKIYVTLFPCNDCAKLLAHSGIKEVFYNDDKYCGTKEDDASKKIFNSAGIKYIKIDKRSD